jgi:lipopolysaccharide transport system ATP-binding protein
MAMAEPSIRIDNLGKSYRKGRSPGQTRLSDAITDWMRAPLSSFRNFVSNPNAEDTFWAIRHATLEIGKGEAVGIVGRNGAGKSTLLKVLARVASPTEGRAELRGKVASLLEVGTGFHPELTGAENIILSGSILGMKRKEIYACFDEIVHFAGVEGFIYTPVKHYSTGMYLRLAFAVGAHLRPDVLLVDEVLALGDFEFQKRSVDKMHNVSNEGRTVLFVSHQLNSIRKLCTKSIWIDGGQIKLFGPTGEVLGAYQSSAQKELDVEDEKAGNRQPAKFLSWQLCDGNGSEAHMLMKDGPLRMKVKTLVSEPLASVEHGIALWSDSNQLMWGWSTAGIKLEPGVYEFTYELPLLPLKPGIYTWDVSLTNEGRMVERWQGIPDLNVATEPLADRRDEWCGILNVPCQFDIQQVQ